MQPCMFSMKLPIHGFPQGIANRRRFVQPHRNLVGLAGVAGIDAESRADCLVLEAGIAQLAHTLVAHGAEATLHVGKLELGFGAEHGRGVVATSFGHEQAARRLHPGLRWNHDPAAAQLAREVRRVHGPGPAERHHHELPRIVTARHGDELQRPAHLRAGQREDALRRGLDAHAQRVGDVFGHGPPRGVNVQLDMTAGKPIGPQSTEHGVGVGGRGSRAAAAVAGRPRLRAGAGRTYVERAAGVHAGDRAAAGADLDKIDHGGAKRIAGAEASVQSPADLVVVVDGDVTVADQGGLGAGAAHVERDDVGRPQPPSDLRGGDHPRGRSRLDDRGRLAGHRGGGRHAAARLHDRERCADASCREPGADVADVGRDPRQNRRMHRRRAEALVLAILAADGVAGDHRQARLVRDDGGCLPLMLRVAVAVQKRHHDRLGPQVL